MQSEKMLMVGYGTFITRRMFQPGMATVCRVKNYRRIYDPNGAWFPFVLPCDGASFPALCFPVKEEELQKKDRYEGVPNLYTRETAKIKLKWWKRSQDAFIYVPTAETIDRHGLSLDIDKTDCWKQVIARDPSIAKEFPQLVKGLKVSEIKKPKFKQTSDDDDQGYDEDETETEEEE